MHSERSPLSDDIKTTEFEQSWDNSHHLQSRHVHFVESASPDDDHELGSSPTVLPDRAAKLVSYFAQGSSLTLRLATYLTETALDSSRVSVLSTLGVSRRVLENILSKADEDTPGATHWAVSCMGFVHESATLTHFATSAYFHLANSLVSTVSYLWQDSIHIMNSIFGSTDSSRAIASILALIQRELGEGAGVYTLATTLVFFSIVQSRSWKRTVEDIEMMVLWDVVVLESGETLAQQQMPERRGKREFEDESIISKIPDGSSYTITADQGSVDTITVEVSANDADLDTWPPVLVIPEEARILHEESSSKILGEKTISYYKLVFEKYTRKFRERKGRVTDRGESIASAGNQDHVKSLHYTTGNNDTEILEITDDVDAILTGDNISGDPPVAVQPPQPLRMSGSIGNFNLETPFPPGHLTYNMAKFVRYASASYGHSFMKLLGIGLSSVSFPKDSGEDGINHHSEHYAFAHHARLKLDQILLSSYTDIAADDTSGIPLVHFVAVDHEAKAVVLTIRGTLGLEDVLTDLTCDYSSFDWHGRSWKAHGGMLRCAQLLMRSTSRVLQTISNALRQWGPGYGLVLCGHSLGGGVAALFGILLSEAASTEEGDEPIFVTSRNTILPSGRLMKVFSYGPPASICTSLRLATKNLIISVVYGLDVVPCLSLGLLRDFQSLAHTLKNDERGIVKEIRRRFLNQIPIRGPLSQQPEQDDDYLFSIMTTLRYVMQNEKLVPPGEVYHINTSTVFETQDGHTRKATRVVGSLIVGVEQRFREPVFGREIFHHSPVYYEKALNTLEMGISQAPI